MADNTFCMALVTAADAVNALRVKLSEIEPRDPTPTRASSQPASNNKSKIASYMIPGKLIKGMGGAMDLVAGADNIIVTMTHASKYGDSKLLSACTLPLTGKGCIKRVLTDLALLDIEDGKFILRERAPGVSVEEIAKLTAGELVIPEHFPEMSV